MCGLVFFSNSAGSYPIEKALNRIAHRGLENRARIQRSEYAQIGHVRLPIQGLSKKYDQPYSTGSPYIMAYVGEVFNYKELSDEPSDVPLVLRNFVSCKAESFSAYDGFWSCVFHSPYTGETYIITDPLAKKPLYIHSPTNSVASEIKALRIFENTNDLDPLYFSSVRKWGYYIGEKTPYKNISKIPRGTILVLDKNGKLVSEKCYSDICQKYPVHARSRLDLKSSIIQAILRRTVSDIPVGVLVSGGLDSSIVYQVLHKFGYTPTDIYHIDNNEEEFLNYLDIPSYVNIHKLSIDSNPDLNKILAANETPVDLGSMISQYQLCQAVKKQGMNVIITGDGADELFGGYRRSLEYDSQYSDVFEELVYYHLPRLDKMSMAHTIELRSPFLSWDVIKGALAIPYEERINKKFLKEAFADIVPKPIIDRSKQALKSPQVLAGGIRWSRELCDLFITNHRKEI